MHGQQRSKASTWLLRHPVGSRPTQPLTCVWTSNFPAFCPKAARTAMAKTSQENYTAGISPQIYMLGQLSACSNILSLLHMMTGAILPFMWPPDIASDNERPTSFIGLQNQFGFLTNSTGNEQKNMKSGMRSEMGWPGARIPDQTSPELSSPNETQRNTKKQLTSCHPLPNVLHPETGFDRLPHVND